MKIIVYCIAALSIIIAHNALASDNKIEIAKCAAITTPIERLSCYDLLSSKLGISGGKSISTAPSSKHTGKWKVSIETSPVDDSKNVYLSLDSKDTIPAMIGQSRPILIARCKEKNTNVYVTWGVYLGLDATKVLMRLDNEKATEVSWGISTDNQATFYGDVDGDIEFLKKLSSHKKLLLQVTPYGQNPVMVSFNLQGLADALQPLKDACNWN